MNGAAREAAHDFYNSPAWVKAREYHLQKVGRLCERCLKQGLVTPARVVHHIQPITPQTINDPRITLDDRNLQALCQDCHAEVHKGEHRAPKRWIVSDDGSVRARE